MVVAVLSSPFVLARSLSCRADPPYLRSPYCTFSSGYPIAANETVPAISGKIILQRGRFVMSLQ
ncbi:unnamed protein product [Chondrus crispus]|uniref:Uncharacterized protein n=1 Tax=Chondrus crispus TaxID=2769 RepID=R7Q765_CHOCR|nr:unnamed protein product [Chondrus crispus]CDF34372.1 unnamed protein product [Chondrus crispus]|eukprot:XP_005714191.1 unnamed protein product [Chondrus crispus]